MDINLDFRGFSIVYDMINHKRLFEALEQVLKEVNSRTAEEFRVETVVEDREDYELLCTSLNGLEEERLRQQQTLWATQIIRLQVLLEGHLKFLCKVTGTARDLKLGLTDLNGSLVERGKLFLGDYADVIPKVHLVWSRIGLLHRLRNHLVHASVEKGAQNGAADVMKIVRICQKFKLIEDGNVVLTKEFCDYLHEGVKELFELLFASMGWRTFRK